MILVQSCAFVVLVCAIVQAGVLKPSQENVPGLRNSHSNDLIEELTGQFRGDLVLRTEQGQSLGDNKRSTLASISSRWPGGIVLYSIFEQHFTSAQIEHIEKAMNHVESHSCVKFVKRTVERNFVNITGHGTGGCSSSAGYTTGLQVLNLHPTPVDTECFKLGEIVHLLLHTLGFIHQHSVFNRDEYVEILWENVDPNMEQNFHRYADHLLEDFGVPYDYDSVMHYGETTYSKNGKRTIVPKDPNARIGQREGLSTGDIIKLNLRYECAYQK
ncbi:seminal metalloprotease 1-like [Anopheles marshallii]|uniref:seminal metalloprotease 1-like n=1 Tax=Anopheles marshallii TaxID=1521116 RepID=UPI00237BFB41|nr:seminal metalloprotease 1-like [Anopheles marshallii]